MKIPKIPGFDQGAIEKYAKNTGWLLIARVGSLGIKVLIGFAVSNYLGSKLLGIYNYPTAFTAFFFAAAALGLDSFITRELLRHPEKRDVLLGTAFTLKLFGGLAFIPIIYGAYLIVNHLNPISSPGSFILIVSFIGVLQAFNIIDSYFQSKAQGKHIMTVQIVGNLFSALSKLLFILLGLDLHWFIYSLLFDVIFLGIGYVYIYQKKAGSIFQWKYDSETAGYLLRNSWPLAFSAVLITIYMSIDKLMIQGYLGDAPLGIYSVVVQLSESWYFIPMAVVAAVFPAIMNAKRDDPQRYQRRMQNMYDIMVWLSLSLAIFITFASPLIFKLLKPEFASGAPILSIHIWAGVFVFLGTANGQFLIAEGYTKLAMVRTGVGAIVNILLNIVWIPEYGIAGAAWATLIAYFSSTFMTLFFTKTRAQAFMMLKSLFLITLVEKVKTLSASTKK